MNFRRLFTFSLVFPTLLLAGCQKENAFDCLKSTGKVKTETRQLAPFRTIRVFDNLKVTIVADTAHFAEVKAGDNLQENILTEVKNGELWVRNINKCNWVRSYDKPTEIKLHLPKIQTIYHEGFGTISSENTLPADTIFLHLIGAGDINLDLKTRRVWLDMYELGDIRLRGTNIELIGFVHHFGSLQASSLFSQDAFLHLTGEGAAHVQASRNLGATIEGNGNVYYYNQPAYLDRHGAGKGSLQKAN